MTNINLSQGNESTKGQSFVVAAPGGLTVFIIILIMTVGLYAGELIYGRKLASDIDRVKGEYNMEFGDLGTKKEFLTVADFQARLDLAKTEVDKGKNIQENLAEIEKIIIPGVYLSSYEFKDTDSTIMLRCVGDNYNVVAKQILNFKKSVFFDSASGGETTYDALENKVKFIVNLKLK